MNPLKRVKLEPAALVSGMAAQALRAPAKPTTQLPWPFTEQHPEWVSTLRNCLKRDQTQDSSTDPALSPSNSSRNFNMFSPEATVREWLLEEGFVRGESLAWRLIYKRQQEGRIKQVKKTKPASGKTKSKEPGKSTWR